jgi:hypothetical protein
MGVFLFLKKTLVAFNFAPCTLYVATHYGVKKAPDYESEEVPTYILFSLFSVSLSHCVLMFLMEFDHLNGEEW